MQFHVKIWFTKTKASFRKHLLSKEKPKPIKRTENSFPLNAFQISNMIPNIIIDIRFIVNNLKYLTLPFNQSNYAHAGIAIIQIPSQGCITNILK